MHFHTNRSEHFESQNDKDYSYSQQNVLVDQLNIPTIHTTEKLNNIFHKKKPVQLSNYL